MDHLNMTKEALIVDMLDDVIDVWIDSHMGGDEACE